MIALSTFVFILVIYELFQLTVSQETKWYNVSVQSRVPKETLRVFKTYCSLTTSLQQIMK